MSEPFNPTRRIAVIAAAAAAIAGAAALEWTRLLGKRYAATPFDDLLGKLGDREASVVFGRAILNKGKSIEGGQIAKLMRQRLASVGFGDLAHTEAQRSDLAEADGWVVPKSVMLMAALAALNTPSGS
jgi:hypothetical protein